MKDKLDGFESTQEKHEAWRVKTVEATVDELLKMLKDDKLGPEARLKAAQGIDHFNDTMVKVNVIDGVKDHMDQHHARDTIRNLKDKYNGGE